MKSLWGDLSDIEEIKTPQEILNEQASFLNSFTESTVLAKLIKARPIQFGKELEFSRDDIFKFEFLLTCPKIPNYSYKIFRMEHSVQLYPISLRIEESIIEEIEPLNDKYKLYDEVIANDEKEFLSILKDVLSSKTIMKVISSLISLSKSI